jgi:hypothetical protein
MTMHRATPAIEFLQKMDAMMRFLLLALPALSCAAGDRADQPCTMKPQPCPAHHPGVTWCVSSSDQNQCDKPMPHKPCPPCAPPPPPLGAAFSLAKSLGDGMVLQRAPGTARVWGFAPSGTVVTTTFKGQALKSVADASKVWRQALPPQPASAVPTTISFKSSDGGNASLTGVLFGDVHLCSGEPPSQRPGLSIFSCPPRRRSSARLTYLRPLRRPIEYGVHATLLHTTEGLHNEQHECRGCLCCRLRRLNPSFHGRAGPRCTAWLARPDRAAGAGQGGAEVEPGVAKGAL